MADNPIDDPVTLARSLLRARLTAAMKAKDRVAAGAVRSVLGALDNAEAVEAPPTATVSTVSTSEYVAAAAEGLGAAEVDRRTLTAADVRQIIEREVADRRAAIPEFVGGGARVEARAGELQDEIDVLEPLLDQLPA